MTIAYGPNTGLIVSAALGEEWYVDLKRFLRWCDYLLFPNGPHAISYGPPASPADGTICVIAQSGLSGAFTGHANQIARYNAADAVWDFLTPVNGTRVGNDVYSSTYGWNSYSAPPDPGPPSSCFPAGTRVLMENGYDMAIESVKVGMRVRGAMGINTVVEIRQPILGDRRLIAMDDASLFWSEEHPFWVYRNGKQWWWTAGYDKWIREVETGEIAGLKDNESMFKWEGGPEDFAHKTGWVKRQPMVVEGSLSRSDLPLYYLILDNDGCKTFFANNYIVSGGTDGLSVDYEKIDWHG